MMPIQQETEKLDAVDVWLQGLTRENTRITYRYQIKRLLAAMRVNGERLVTLAKQDPSGVWLDAKSKAAKFPPSSRYLALNALLTFLQEKGVYINARLDPPPKPRRVRLTWDEAEKIAQAASRPYNLIFKLMLYDGWGISQFLEFNTQEAWKEIRDHQAKKPLPEYYRHEFGSRKSSRQPYHSLIPTKLLCEVLEANMTLPFVSKRRVSLNLSQYKRARQTLDSEFRAAVLRSEVRPQGRVTLHEFRDTFFTMGSTHGVAIEARQFALGHTVDPLGYDKCWNDDAWMWGELSKIYDKNEL